MNDPTYTFRLTRLEAYGSVLFGGLWWVCAFLAWLSLTGAIAYPHASWFTRLLSFVMYLVATALCVGMRYILQVPDKDAT